VSFLALTVITRTKISGDTRRRRREGQSMRSAPVSAGTAARRRREAGAPQDQAMYSCACGFVFEAQVSTSVGCPHCGDSQAW
jgi:hypothetical protein